MKIIHLLVKIATGDKLPNKIKYCGYIFEYDTNHSRYESYFDEQIWTLEDFVNINDNLNDEVEIIEDTPKEDKKIEKLNEHYYHDEPALIDDMAHKINEIIEVLNENTK